MMRNRNAKRDAIDRYTTALAIKVDYAVKPCAYKEINWVDSNQLDT